MYSESLAAPSIRAHALAAYVAPGVSVESSEWTGPFHVAVRSVTTPLSAPPCACAVVAESVPDHAYHPLVPVSKPGLVTRLGPRGSGCGRTATSSTKRSTPAGGPSM